MGGFDGYLKEKRQQEEFIKRGEEQEQQWQPIDLFQQDYEGEQAWREQNKGIGGDAEDGVESLSYVEESIRLKEANSTFEERTEYYYKDTKYMEAKEARYRSIADGDDGKVEEFAKKHTNRSARKRKKKAKAAADNFAKAKKLEEGFNDAGGDSLPPEDIYESRNAIMRARLEGMINAAKVKATSKQDENYRIAKAKLSCLSTLLDQSEHLRSKKSEYFDKVQADLQKEIESAKKDLQKYGQDPTARWMEALGCNDNEALEKDLKESNNPNATLEDAKLSKMFLCMSQDFTRPEYVETFNYVNENNIFGGKMTARKDELVAPMNIIRRDKQGNPINKEEKRKEEWNKKWLEVYKDPEKKFERKKMLLESFERFKKLQFPSPAELKEKGIGYFIKKDPANIYALNSYILRLDNLRHIDPIIGEYYEFDKEFRAKMEAGENFSTMVNKYLQFEHNIDPATYKLIDKDKFKDKDENEIEEIKQEEREEIQSYQDGFEKTYGPVEEAYQERKTHIEGARFKKVLSFDEAKKNAKEQKVDDIFTEKSYELYKSFHKTNQQIDNPYYRERYAPVIKKLGSTNDISRLSGAMLRQVHFDENWMPISKEDMEAHEWNMKYLNNLKTYITETDLTPGEQESLSRAKQRLEKNEITQEEFEKHSVNKKIKEKKENSARVLDEMIQEEYTKSYCEENFPLPTPEQLMKEVVEPLKNFDGKTQKVPEIPLLENYIKDTEKHSSLCIKGLCFEGPVKQLPFAAEFVKKNPVMNKYHTALSTLPLIISAYVSHKYGIDPESGSNVKIRKSSAGPKLIGALVDVYVGNYNEYKAERDKVK